MQELPLELIRTALLQYAEEELDWGSYGSYINYYDSINRQYDVPGLGTVTIVDCHSYDSDKNYDGWSEDIWVVFDIQGKLYRATGTYTSYSGDDWDDNLKLVKPVEKTITVFEDVE